MARRLCYQRGMAVRFIIGRAGSGKTHHCLEAIRDRLRHDPVDGYRLVLLVPEQASLQMERAILEPGANAGEAMRATHRGEVLSFQRLAFRVLDAAGQLGGDGAVLSETARAMVLRHLVSEHADQLQYYRRAARASVAGGLITRLASTLTELMQEAVDPSALLELADDDGGRAGADPAQRAKLHDIHLIYEAYLAYLATGKLDTTQYLELAREQLPHCSWLAGMELWVDGFASYSVQESQMLVALAKLAKHVDITVMADPSVCVASGRDASDPRTQLFARPVATYRDLRRRFENAGVAVDEDLSLEASGTPRFLDGGAIATVERCIFQSPPADEGIAGSPQDEVEIVSLPTRRLEAEYAVSRIHRFVQDHGGRYRYRDIAIICRDLGPYHDLLSAALTGAHIPFFIDRRRPVVHHPLVELLRGGVQLAAQPMAIEPVRLLLKTGLLPVSIEDGDELENYLIAHGVSGETAWSGPDWTNESRFGSRRGGSTPYETASLSRINAARRVVSDHVSEWLALTTGNDRPTGEAWSSAIVSWWQRLGVGEQLASWAGDAEDDGDLDQAEEHRQVERDIAAFLDDLVLALGDVRLDPVELADVVEAGLAGLTLGLVPPMVDQVLVGSIERSRHPDIKVALIVGFNDGVFPMQLSEDPILNDDDRGLLIEHGLAVRPPLRRRIVDERTLAYVALTRASEHVVVSYALSDDDGRSARPSPYLGALKSAGPGIEVKCLADPVRSRQPWDVRTLGDLTRRFALEFRSRLPRTQDDPILRGRWNELYATSQVDLSTDSVTVRALRSLDEPEDTQLSPNVLERLHAGPLRTSVSQLESFAACPFQHFARHTLRLRERSVAQLAAVDMGLVHHAILEDFIATLAKGEGGIGQLSESQLTSGLEESCSRVAATLPEDGTVSDARNAYLLRRSASDLARVVHAQRSRSQAGGLRERKVELPFGMADEGSLPALVLSTPNGRRVMLRGYIDRVDLAELGDELLGVVVDYKRTRDKRLDMSRVFHGLSLQLLAYLLVLAEQGTSIAGRPIRPIGALFVSLTAHYNLVDHPTDVNDRSVSLKGTDRPRGLIDADRFGVLDSSDDKGWSQHYSLYRKKDGQLGNIDRGDGVERSTFEAMLEHTRTRLGGLADSVLDGIVAVRPVRLGSFSPCAWCTMRSACRFEQGISPIVYLESFKRSSVFERLQQSPTPPIGPDA